MSTETPSAVSIPAGVPAEAVPFLREVGYLEPDRLSVGDPAPDAALCTPTGEPLSLRHLWAERPAVLIFGSYT